MMKNTDIEQLLHVVSDMRDFCLDYEDGLSRLIDGGVRPEAGAGEMNDEDLMLVAAASAGHRAFFDKLKGPCENL